jgi:hypothetical protein
MTKYWPATELANLPGMHPHLAYELCDANRTGMLGHEAMEQGYIAAVNELAIPLNVPIALPPNTGGAGQPVFLKHPTAWEFHKLERAGILYLGESYIFIGCALH